MTINEEKLKKYDANISEIVAMMFLQYVGNDIQEVLDELFSKGFVEYAYGKKYVTLTKEGESCLKDIVFNKKQTNKIYDNSYNIELAKKMAQCFPKTIKPGTNVYFRSNPKETSDKLKKFFEKFGEYSEEDILKATQKYVDTHVNNNDLKTMRVLKYFIWKDDEKFDEDGNLKVVRKSELADYLENLDSDDDNQLEMFTELR